MRRTIPTLFRDAVDEVADQPWLFAESTALTYAEALERVERAASWCRAAGLGPGDRVLVTARNTPDYLLTWLALMEVGAVQVPINPSSSGPRSPASSAQGDPRVIVTDLGLMPSVVAAAEEARSEAVIVDVGELFAAEPDGTGPADVEPEDVAVMIPTSGTTGRSKLVMQTHLRVRDGRARASRTGCS